MTPGRKTGLSIALDAVSVRRGERWVLRDIDLRLRPGERWALIGENGSGKTQLLKLLGGAVWPTPTGKERRVYRIGRRRADLIEAKHHIAYVGGESQDKYARYAWDLPVRDLVATGLHRTDLLLRPVTRVQQRRVASILSACGLTQLATRKFSALSYGQKRLVLLARALVQAPDWLLLDEFYNGLDAHYRERINGVLDDVCRHGQSWIAAAHRAVDVPRGTRGLIELQDGRLGAMRAMRAADLVRLGAAARLDDAVSFTSMPAGVEPYQRLRSRKPNTGAAPRGIEPGSPLRRTTSKSGAAPRLGAAARVTQAQPLLELRDAVLYVDYRVVLRDLNWQLRAGQHWAVVGANGAGKSSLLKLLYGDLSPASGGRIERSGFPKGTPIADWKREVGYVSPELQSDYAVDVPILDLVASGRHASIGLLDAMTAQDRRTARYWLKFFALSTFAKRRPRELSYGQLRRALIARALAGNPRLLLLDEPLTGLDPRQRALMQRLLERLMKRGLTLVIAVHHPADLPRGVTHVLRLHKRRAYASIIQSAT